MRRHTLPSLAIGALLAALGAACLCAAPPPAALTSQPAIPVETLRTVFLNLHKTADVSERLNTPAGTASALEKYRKMQQMMTRFPDLKVDSAYKDLLTSKIKQLEPQVVQNVRQAAEKARAARQARANAARANFQSPGNLSFLPGGTTSGGSSSFAGSNTRGASRSAPACPPGRT